MDSEKRLVTLLACPPVHKYMPSTHLQAVSQKGCIGVCIKKIVGQREQVIKQIYKEEGKGEGGVILLSTLKP